MGLKPTHWPTCFPQFNVGVLGVKFVDAAVASHQQDGRWVDATIDVR